MSRVSDPEGPRAGQGRGGLRGLRPERPGQRDEGGGGEERPLLSRRRARHVCAVRLARAETKRNTICT